MTSIFTAMRDVPLAEEGEEALESVVVNPDDMTITLTSDKGDVKVIQCDSQDELNEFGMAMRLELYDKGYDTQTTSEAVRVQN